MDATTWVRTAGVEEVFRTQGVVDGARGLAELEVEVAGVGTVRQRRVGDVLYLALPQRPATWFSLALQDVVGSGSGIGADPSADVLKQLREATRNVQVIGTHRVGGVDTTHYRGSVDIAKSATALGGAVGELAARAQDADASFDAYLDADGLLRKVTTSASFTTPGVSGRITTMTQMIFTDYGVEIDVSAPPGELVEDGSFILDALVAGPPG